MKEITQYQSKAPTKLSLQAQKKLDSQRIRVYYTKELARSIIDQESDLFGYAVWKTVFSSLVAEKLVQSSCPEGLSSHQEELYNQLQKELMDNVHKITAEASAQLIAELDRIPTEISSGTLLEEIVLKIGRVLQE